MQEFSSDLYLLKKKDQPHPLALDTGLVRLLPLVPNRAVAKVLAESGVEWGKFAQVNPYLFHQEVLKILGELASTVGGADHYDLAKNRAPSLETVIGIPNTALTCSDVITESIGPETAIAPFLISSACVVPTGISSM